jgi:hypothetical protein
MMAELAVLRHTRAAYSSNENKMSDGGRERGLLGVKAWKSYQMWSVQRSVVRSIAWLGLFACSVEEYGFLGRGRCGKLHEIPFPVAANCVQVAVVVLVANGARGPHRYAVPADRLDCDGVIVAALGELPECSDIAW